VQDVEVGAARVGGVRDVTVDAVIDGKRSVGMLERVVSTFGGGEPESVTRNAS
jgi:hypothetical protein